MTLKDVAEVVLDDVDIYDRNSNKNLFTGNTDDNHKEFDDIVEKFGLSEVQSIEPTTCTRFGMTVGKIIIEIYAAEE